MASVSIRTVLIDLDGTLALSLGSLQKCYHRFLQNFGAQGSDQEFRECDGPSLIQIVDKLKKRHSLPCEVPALHKAYLNVLLEDYQNSIDLRAGALELLEWLHGMEYKIGLVTSASAQLADAFTSRHRIQKYFSIIVTGDQVSQSKPSSEIYLRALLLSSLHAAETVAIEDSPNGVKSASSAGIKVIGLADDRHESSLLEAGALIVAPTLFSVPSLLSHLVNHQQTR